MNKYNLANIIHFIHIIFVIIMLISPWSNQPTLYKFYKIMVPALLFRWLTNYSKCDVTMIESKLRGIDESQGFIYKLVNPIYTFKSEKFFNYLLYFYMILTWFLVRERMILLEIN